MGSQDRTWEFSQTTGFQSDKGGSVTNMGISYQIDLMLAENYSQIVSLAQGSVYKSPGTMICAFLATTERLNIFPVHDGDGASEMIRSDQASHQACHDTRPSAESITSRKESTHVVLLLISM
jgi:hypothetical protein